MNAVKKSVILFTLAILLSQTIDQVLVRTDSSQQIQDYFNQVSSSELFIDENKILYIIYFLVE